ncbi:MAG: hypothetical protein QY326_04980 [Bdellovibrionota bacterium]|nr:MAG: hypothetical protein QY326_04980 [Bdellovibrionota bacterium]
MMRELHRRWIYLLVALALSVPLILRVSVPPARMRAADRAYDLIRDVEIAPHQIVLMAFDFGPNIKAENGSQAEVVLEHLMRRRIPVALFSLYVQAEPFLKSIPEKVASRLMAENPGEVWRYGEDWVNLGFRPGNFLVLQSLARSEDITAFFGKDAFANRLADIAAFRNAKTVKDIALLVEISGLQGMLELYLRFFRAEGYVPKVVHGCTSISIPDAYIFLDSGQLSGLLEGIAGAAWYSARLRKEYPRQEADEAQILNTSLGVAHLLIILLVIVGNVVAVRSARRGVAQA